MGVVTRQCGQTTDLCGDVAGRLYRWARYGGFLLYPPSTKKVNRVCLAI